jgi:CubicO group peptidase (beta-lactamase class C family)
MAPVDFHWRGSALWIVVGLTISPARAAGPIDVWAKGQMARYHLPGMIVAVYKNGKPLQISEYGFADLRRRLPIRRDSIFEICSITKQFTAAAILILAQEGKLKIDDPLRKYIPEAPESWSSITLREVMRHTSGISDRIFGPDFAYGPEREELKRLRTLPAPNPKLRWSYSNLGYWLLGKVIERVSNTPYYTFLQRRIFNPLGMMDTHPNSQKISHRRLVHGYLWNKTTHRFDAAPDLTAVMGFSAGGLISSVDDMNRWSEALATGRILAAKSRLEMLEPAKLSDGRVASAAGQSSGGYGLGVFLSGSRDHPVEKHSGGWGNGCAQFTRFVKDRLTVVILTNGGGWGDRSWAGEEVGSLFIKGFRLPSWVRPTGPRSMER